MRCAAQLALAESINRGRHGILEIKFTRVICLKLSFGSADRDDSGFLKNLKLQEFNSEFESASSRRRGLMMFLLGYSR